MRKTVNYGVSVKGKDCQGQGKVVMQKEVWHSDRPNCSCFNFLSFTHYRAMQRKRRRREKVAYIGFRICDKCGNIYSVKEGRSSVFWVGVYLFKSKSSQTLHNEVQTTLVPQLVGQIRKNLQKRFQINCK